MILICFILIIRNNNLRFGSFFLNAFWFMLTWAKSSIEHFWSAVTRCPSVCEVVFAKCNRMLRAWLYMALVRFYTNSFHVLLFLIKFLSTEKSMFTFIADNIMNSLIQAKPYYSLIANCQIAYSRICKLNSWLMLRELKKKLNINFKASSRYRCGFFFR